MDHIHVGLQTLGRNRREVLPHGRSFVLRASWVCDCVLYHEHRRAIHFTVSGIGPSFNQRLSGILLGS